MIRGNPASKLRAGAAAMFFGAVVAAPAAAQSPPSEQWQFIAIIYGYLPKISGSATFPTGTTANISVDPNQIINNLKFAFMGAVDARKGPWDFFTDVLYMDVSDSKSQTRDLSIGGMPIPLGITADANLKIKSTLWTLAGGYRFIDTPQWTLDVFGGARDVVLKQTLGFSLSADVGPFVGPLRQGTANVNVNNWDGIIGTKGRFMFGERREWFVPYYADVGTGQSKYTWQTYVGLGYAFSWGELIGVWRYIEYKFDAPSNPTLKLNGPAIGVAFHW